MRFRLFNCSDLLWIRLDPVSGYDVSQELKFLPGNLALLPFDFQVCLLQGVQNFQKIVEMNQGRCSRVDDDIVEEDEANQTI